MAYERTWERLIEHLDELGSAREVPGGIEVTVEQWPGHPRTIELVVEPVDWDNFLMIMYGDGDPAPTRIKEMVLAVPEGVLYLVYDGTYGWGPSETRELRADDFDPGPGQWVVADDDGNVIDRFGDYFDERQERLR